MSKRTRQWATRWRCARFACLSGNTTPLVVDGRVSSNRGRDWRAWAGARSDYESDSDGVLAARLQVRRSASTFVTAESAPALHPSSWQSATPSSSASAAEGRRRRASRDWGRAGRSPPCRSRPPFPTAQASFRPVVAAESCGEQRPCRECRLGNEPAVCPEPWFRRVEATRAGLLSRAGPDPESGSWSRQRRCVRRVSKLLSLSSIGCWVAGRSDARVSSATSRSSET